MPTPHHEALVELIRVTPLAALDHLARLAGVVLPEHDDVTPLDASIRDLASTERRADLVLGVEGRGGAGCVVIIEVQRGVDPDKSWRWPRYMTAVRDDKRRAVVLIVLATTEAVAEWARLPIEIGPGNALSMVVVGPRDIPRLETLPEGERTALAALLSAAVHLDGLEDLRTMQRAVDACWPLPGVGDMGGADVYREVFVALLKPGLRATMEAEMLGGQVDPLFEKLKDRFLEMGIERGREEGREEGREAGALETARLLFVRLALQRGWALAPHRRRKLEACRDSGTLAAWVERVVTAASLDEALSA